MTGSTDGRALRDQLAGCLVGGAIGDGLGSAVEGRTRVSPADLETEWRLSDDTQLTLATCEAVREAGLSPEAVAAAFVRWFKAGRLTGLGTSTLKALRELEAGAHWALTGRKGEMAAGNGAAMRVAPLAFLVDLENLGHRRAMRDICRITHHNDEAYAGALAVVVALQQGILTPEAPLALEAVRDELPDTAVRDRLAEIAPLVGAAPLAEVAARFGCSGFVVESVPLALFAVAGLDHLSFEELSKELVLAGGDTDTNVSIFGQVAGARMGFSGLPGALVNRVPGAGRRRARAGGGPSREGDWAVYRPNSRASDGMKPCIFC